MITGLSLTVSKIKDDLFLLKIASLTTVYVFITPANEVPSGKCNGSEFKTTGDWCLTLSSGKKFDEFIRLYTVPQCDGRTDGRTDGVGKTISRYAC